MISYHKMRCYFHFENKKQIPFNKAKYSRDESKMPNFNLNDNYSNFVGLKF